MVKIKKKYFIRSSFTFFCVLMLLFSSLTFATDLLPRTNLLRSSTKQLTDENDLHSDLLFSRSNGTVLYVGGSGPGNFSTIQNAIDNATDYDSIFVYNGVYYENIIIDKKVSLIGEQQSSTIIDGNNLAITVTIEKDDSSIQFFTIRNGNYYGIFLDNTYRAIVKNNLITSNVDHGIFGYSIIDCIISNNEIASNENGIKLDYSSRRCSIQNNSIHDHSQNGIFLKSSYENAVEYNSLINNKYDIELNQCNDTEILHNTIHNHGETGIQLKKSDQNNIKYNTIIFENEGIEIWDESQGNNVIGNTIKNNQPASPIAIDDAINTFQNDQISINVTVNDYDRDGKINISSITIVESPMHGTISDISSGIIVYNPSTNYNGTDQFTYILNDEAGLVSNEAQVTVNVISDDLGEVIADQQSFYDRSFSFYSDIILAQSFHPDFETLTNVGMYLKKTGNPPGDVYVTISEENISGATVYSSTMSSSEITNTLEWRLFDEDDIQLDSSKVYFLKVRTTSGNMLNSYQWGHSVNDSYPQGVIMISEDEGDNWELYNSSDFCFQLFKTPGIPPVVANDSYEMVQSEILTISSPGILQNDDDADDAEQQLSVILDQDVSHGSLSLNADGSFEYIPTYDFTGVDQFSYMAFDGEQYSSIAIVTINVTDQKSYCIIIPSSISSSSNNQLYHNNLYSGTPNCLGYDEYDNNWDNGSSSSIGGNYWSDHNEISEGVVDSTGDLIFEQSVSVPGGDANDDYPLTQPWDSYEPIANFSWMPIGPETDLRIQFTDLSVDFGYGTIIEWFWSFGDGSNSTIPTPDHVYDNIGTYNVSLTVVDDDGLTDTMYDYVIVSANPPTADFTWDPLEPSTQDDVQFTDLSTDDNTVVSWMWDFDDGNTSTQQHPVHRFADNGAYQVSLTVGDDDGAIDVVTKDVMVSNVAPTVVNDSMYTQENTPLWIDVLANDDDVDGFINSSSLSIITNPLYGTAIVDGTGILYTPQTNFSGIDTFDYQVADDDEAFGSATVTINVTHVNIPPVAHDDEYNFTEDVTLTVSIPGILENDEDSDNGPNTMTAYLVSNTSNGTISLNTDGSFTYQPNNNFSETDFFTYQVFDGSNFSNVAMVTLSGIPVNDPPLAMDDSYEMNEDTIFYNTSVSVLDNDIDIDSSEHNLTCELVSNTSSGFLEFYDNGSFLYQPNPDYYGTDTFSYQVFDGMNYSNNATVTITIININDPPVAENDYYWTNEDEDLIVDAPGVLKNDSDIDSSSLSAILISTTGHGSLSFNADGSFEYNPNPDFYGFDSFTYQAFDGSNTSDIAVVTIQIFNINEAPISDNDSYTVDEDTLLSVNSPGVLANDDDPDNGPSSLTAVLTKNASYGTVELQEDGSFTYLSDDNYSGTDSFRYQAFDGLNHSMNATVTITINEINDPPVAVDNLYNTDEDTMLCVNAPGVLSNDIDAESEIGALTAQLMNSTSDGSLQCYANGSFIYTPNVNFFGIDSFTYQAYDGMNYSNIATVTIIVNSINDVPIATNDVYTTMEDVPLSINGSSGMLANDVDPDNYPEPLTANLTSNVTKGTLTFNETGSFYYVPDAEFYGNVSFSYQAFDGLNYSNKTGVTIIVTQVNDTPQAEDDAYFTRVNETLTVGFPGVLENDVDPDTPIENLTVDLISDTSNGTLNLFQNGSFTYTPNINFSGNDTFTYQIYDEISYSNTAVVTISVIRNNSIPIANDDNYTMIANEELWVSAPGVLHNDINEDGGIALLTAYLLENTSHGSLTLYSNGSFDYQPDPGWFGVDSFSYQAFDGLNYSNTAVVTIFVLEGNSVPIAVNDSYGALQNTWCNITMENGVLTNDFDTDASPDPLSAVITSPVSHGIVSLFENGSFTYLPNPGFTGVDSFTYQAFDGLNYSNTATVSLTVTSNNQKPVAIEDSFILDEDDLLSVSEGSGVLANDYDPDNGPDPLEAVLVDTVSKGSLLFFSNGSFTYQPDENISGTDSFSYQAYDGQQYSNVTLVTLSITEINDEPIAMDDEIIVAMNTSVLINVTSNDIDVDGMIDHSSVTITSHPDHGSAVVLSNGLIEYTPTIDFTGMDTLNYTVNDNNGSSSNEAVVTIDVVNFSIDIDQSVFDRGFPIRHAGDGDWAAAQNFTPMVNTLSKIRLYLRAFGTPDFDLTVELREDSLNGTLLETVIVSAEDVPTSWTWFDIDFDDVTVTPGIDYFIVIPPAPSGVTTSFGYEWGYAYGNVYDDGSFWFTRDGGNLWRDLSDSYDFCFQTVYPVS